MIEIWAQAIEIVIICFFFLFCLWSFIDLWLNINEEKNAETGNLIAIF